MQGFIIMLSYSQTKGKYSEAAIKICIFSFCSILSVASFDSVNWLIVVILNVISLLLMEYKTVEAKYF